MTVTLVKDWAAMSGTSMTSPSAPAPPGLPACAEVDLAAIGSNVAALKALAGRAEVMAVVKADAYGHGLVPSARAALRGGATWLGVAQLPEAVELRRAGVEAPLLSWLHVPGQDFVEAVNLGIDLGISTTWALDQVRAAATISGQTARVHLKVDTGLGRNGAWDAELEALLAALASAQAERAVEVVGLFSHFAYADAPQHPTVKAQQERFEAIVAQAARAGITPQVRHLANSAATLTNPSAHYDLVRPGVSVYGLSPGPRPGRARGLRPSRGHAARGASVQREGLACGTRRLVRPRLHHEPGHQAWSGADGLQRWRATARHQCRTGAGGWPQVCRGGTGLHGPVRPRPGSRQHGAGW